jgi:hypothetical protein
VNFHLRRNAIKYPKINHEHSKIIPNEINNKHLKEKFITTITINKLTAFFYLMIFIVSQSGAVDR